MTDTELQIAALKKLGIPFEPEDFRAWSDRSKHEQEHCISVTLNAYPISSTEGRDIIARLEEKLLVTDEDWMNYYGIIEITVHPPKSVDVNERCWGFQRGRQASPLACLKALEWKLVKP